MSRKISQLAPGWWDFSTLDDEILKDAARLSPEEMMGLSREGFRVVFYDTLEDFYMAEALVYSCLEAGHVREARWTLRLHWSHRIIASGGSSGQ